MDRKQSQNVFTDLAYLNPEERQLKTQIALHITDILDQKGWTQEQAAQVIGLDQANVSPLGGGQLAGFSVERLLDIVTKVDHNVEVRISREACAPDEAHMRMCIA